MIKVLFPPGCYGTYLARCLYSYTNLNTEKYSPLDFDSAGSCHVFRNQKQATKMFWLGHIETFCDDNPNNTIVILPDQEHQLDYYNNQFHKNQNQQLIEYMLTQLTAEDICNKLQNGWGYSGPFDLNIPKWILREFFSLWIIDCFSNGYSLQKYNSIDNCISVGAQDIINNFYPTFKKICKKFKLIIIVDEESIIQTHNLFLKSQHYLDCQINCKKWVYDTIAKKENTYTLHTIFDEAYIQGIFRLLGYEIRCNELNSFPKSTLEMATLIYPI